MNPKQTGVILTPSITRAVTLLTTDTQLQHNHYTDETTAIDIQPVCSSLTSTVKQSTSTEGNP